MRWPWTRVNEEHWYSAPGVNVRPPTRGFQLGAEGLVIGFDTAASLEADSLLLEQLAGVSSARVSRHDAMSVPAVLKARNMIAGIASTFPIHCYDRNFNVDDRNSVVSDAHVVIPNSFIYAATIEDLLFESRSYWRVTRFGADGFPIEAVHVDLRAVSQHAILGMPSEVLSADLQFSPRDPIYIDGMFVPRREIIQFVSPNPPLLVHGARAIRQALLLDMAAEIAANEPVPLGYFTDAEDADPLDDIEITDLLNDWRVARAQHAWAYVPNSLKAATLSWSPEQLQLADARQHAVLEIARATGLDPIDMGVDTSSSHTYQNVEQRRFDLVDLVQMPYLTAVEQRLSKNDVLPRGIHARFDVSSFLRADTKTRFEAYKNGIEAGAITVAEVRRAEHRPPLTDGERADRKSTVPPVATTVVNTPGGGSPIASGNGVKGNGREPAEVT
jgi:Phage portal protein